MTSEQSSPIKLMLVDDEEDLTSFLAQRLRKRQMEVVTANNGTDAVALADKSPIHVAVVDLKMPGMSGIEVMEAIKAKQPFLETIMLTGHGSQDSAWEAGKLQAFRYLLKPYDFDELHDLILAAAEERRRSLYKEYNLKRQELLNAGSSTRDILEQTEKLRREYEQG